jgi:REP element-mobilizing transposase RayT
MIGRHSSSRAIYAVTSVIRGRAPLLADARNAALTMQELARCEAEQRVGNIAWVVMPDHVHWLFQLRRGALGSSVQAFKSRVARGINQACASGMMRTWPRRRVTWSPIHSVEGWSPGWRITRTGIAPGLAVTKICEE